LPFFRFAAGSAQGGLGVSIRPATPKRPAAIARRRSGAAKKKERAKGKDLSPGKGLGAERTRASEARALRFRCGVLGNVRNHVGASWSKAQLFYRMAGGIGKRFAPDRCSPA
jgi:hypothetical protein